ncbi:RNA polymerase sigma factor [Candidatus Parcubacteria bacterium]|nr:RNA polymerase sigma factor [Candidatus Parcubacteria bacterium]
MNIIKEKILLAKIRAGDEKSFSLLYDLYADRIFRFISFKITSSEEAEDLTSEVFMRAWRYFQNGYKIDNLKAFLYRVSRNAIIDFYKKNYNKKTVGLEECETAENSKKVKTGKNLIDKIDLDIELKQVLQNLDLLKDEYKEIILLRFIEDYSASEISKIMNRSKGAIRVLMHRALNALKDQMQK